MMLQRTLARWILLGGALLATLVAAVWPAGKHRLAPEVVAPVTRIADRRPDRANVREPTQLPTLDRPERQHMTAQVPDLFGATDWNAPPPAPPVKPASPSAANAPPPAPMAPPFPYTIAGVVEDVSGTMVVFTRQNENFVMRVGEVLEQTYRVDAVGSETATVTYLPLRLTQVIPMTARN